MFYICSHQCLPPTPASQSWPACASAPPGWAWRSARPRRRREARDKWLEYFQAFDRCFFSARVGIALEMRLARAGICVERAEPRSDREDLLDRETLADPPEREDALRYTERDRDREVERASFPTLIRALERVAEGVPALPGPEPAELPTLRELLARVKARPAPAAAVPARPDGSEHSLTAHSPEGGDPGVFRFGAARSNHGTHGIHGLRALE
jgi:hypothetical protein